MTQESTTQADLPSVLAEIASVAGEEVALALARKLGGSSLYVARRPRENSLLVQAVGIDAARAIAGLYGGENINVPLAHSARLRRRKCLIHSLIDEGVSINEVARRLGIDRRTVQRTKSRSDGSSVTRSTLSRPDIYDFGRSEARQCAGSSGALPSTQKSVSKKVTNSTGRTEPF